MSLFEFLLVIFSIVIGIGIAELVKGIARLLRTHRIDEIGVIVPSLTVLVFLIYLQFFWESWSLQDKTEWTFPAMLLFLIPPVLINLVAHIMFPNADDKKSVEDTAVPLRTKK